MIFLKRLIIFGYQQALSCLFPVLIFLTLAVSRLVDIPFMYRYDFIFIVCLLIQAVMYFTGLETKDEVKVICIFHLIGLALEMFKVHVGSWAYPEVGLTKIWGVPLYSGFMYASVASYLIQAWRRLDIQLRNWPSSVVTVPLGSAIYLNFFTHHLLYDFRWMLTLTLFVVFYRTWVQYRVDGIINRMPLTLSFLLIGFFIWLAENIATFFGAWQYPDQKDAWTLVHIGKISSWFLLVIISFIIVAQLKHVKAEREKRNVDSQMSLDI